MRDVEWKGIVAAIYAFLNNNTNKEAKGGILVSSIVFIASIYIKAIGNPSYRSKLHDFVI